MKIIVVGANEYGINIISSLLKLHHEVVLIEKSIEYASFLRKNSGLTVINGDARLLATLKEADIKTADLQRGTPHQSATQTASPPRGSLSLCLPL